MTHFIQRCTLATVSACMLLLAVPAQATLINHDNGSFTDSSTGYVWRTLGQYDGLRYADAVALLPAGYHAASETELATLTAGTQSLVSLIAGTGAVPAGGMVWGFYGDGSSYVWLAEGDAAWNSNVANSQGWTNWGYEVGPDIAFAGLSLFAVDTAARVAVPEPSSLAIVCTGLMLLGWLQRKA